MVATEAAVVGLSLFPIGVLILIWGAAKWVGVPQSAEIHEPNGASVLAGIGAGLIVFAVLLLLYAAQFSHVPNE